MRRNTCTCRWHSLGTTVSSVWLCLLMFAGCRESDGSSPYVSWVPPLDPRQYGALQLGRVLEEAGSDASVELLTVDDPEGKRVLAESGLVLDERPESFVAVSLGDDTFVVGHDSVGSMYGALELAERVRFDGADVLPLAVALTGSPSIPIRGANLFLVLPDKGESRWWFLDQGFWQEYLDLLALARINFLDLHGMYNLNNTQFPNALLHFAESKSLPYVGVSAEARERNVSMLSRVVRMAAERGIRVGLMTYRCDGRTSGDPGPPYLTDTQLRLYNREASEDLCRRVPGLWRLGFRVGESGNRAPWYISTIVSGVMNADTGAAVYTRTWLSSKEEILEIVESVPDEILLEAKYNGEHLGPPYVVAGGVIKQAMWWKYSYEDYLIPPMPYGFVFQVRSGGTHRIFRHASFDRIRRTVGTTTMGGARGFSLEPPHAYYPQRDFYHAEDEDRFSPWTFRRDELQYLLFGRLAYDPATPERVFRRFLAERVGTDRLWEPLQAASDIVPWIMSAHMCGIDHRTFAPEFELGGTVAEWAAEDLPGYQGPFDIFAVASPYEAARDLVAGRATTRLSPVEVALLVLDDVSRARRAAEVMYDPDNAEARDVVRECVAVADLGEYFAHKLRAATALAVYSMTGVEDYLEAAREETSAACDGWTALAWDTSYILPFAEMLRMSRLGYPEFHWRYLVASLEDDPASVELVAQEVAQDPPDFHGTLPPAGQWLEQRREPGPGLASLDIVPHDGAAAQWTVTANLAADPPSGSIINILWKTFSGLSNWNSVRATGRGTRYQAVIAGGGKGALFAVEVLGGVGQGWRYPDVRVATPYVVLEP